MRSAGWLIRWQVASFPRGFAGGIWCGLLGVWAEGEGPRGWPLVAPWTGWDPGRREGTWSVLRWPVRGACATATVPCARVGCGVGKTGTLDARRRRRRRPRALRGAMVFWRQSGSDSLILFVNYYLL